MIAVTNISGLELCSRITSAGTLELWLNEAVTPAPAPDEVLIRVEASPINPSDLSLLLGPADLSTMRSAGSAERPTLTAQIPETHMAALAGRLDEAMRVGTEGAGIVVKAGAEAQDFAGKRVAAWAPGMYAHYQTTKASECMVLPDEITSRQGASAFINPLSVLCMIETMRREGHHALVYTAAASNLGQMLIRVCLADKIPLVNIVRNSEQERTLRGLGAEFVINSSKTSFVPELTDAIAETGATLAFDAIGGGTLAATILSRMETALSRNSAVYNRYGSSVLKQMYLYGMLDRGPTIIARDFGMGWNIGGWLMGWYMQKIGPTDAQRLRERVLRELTTTFASNYTQEISLTEALIPKTVAAYSKRSTGEKYLITPQKSIP